MITRKAALDLLLGQNPEPHLMHHALASEAVMRLLAEREHEDVDLWGLAGLLHDIDFPVTRNTPEQHGVYAMTLLDNALPESALAAIRAHNSECNGHTPTTRFDIALRCAETVTGLVSAAALVRPTRMEGMKASSLKKKMKDSSFAASVSRDRIKECSQLDMELGDFLTLAITAITPIAANIGLCQTSNQQ